MKKLKAVLSVLLVALLAFSCIASTDVKAATVVNLGTADDFAVLAGSAITATGTSNISGDVGLSPTTGSAITGITAGEVTGTIYAVNAAGPPGSVNNPALLSVAKDDLATAYDNAAGQTPATTIATELTGTTRTAGIYRTDAGMLELTGTLTLDAEGDPDAVFIFKAASTLITAVSSDIDLINGAQACNVFWQVGSSATLGVNSVFKGNILASSSITVGSGANVEGRVLARDGVVTLAANVITAAACVVPPPLPPVVIPAVPPLINVLKVPAPLVLPAGPGSVTYDYTVTNVGTVAMSSITMSDNTCASVSFISGDTNSDLLLDTSETWIYRCTTTVSQTTTNTVTASGTGNSITVSDTASATVAVGVTTTPPLIHLIKRPNIFLVTTSGQAVTYAYTVTNPGTEPLHDVSVIDDKCTGLPGRVVGHPGDINANNLLESTEIWRFTCLTNLTQTTTNIGTAEGQANGLTAVDFSPATVVAAMSIPSLPDTGLPGKSIKIDSLALLTGLFVFIAAVILIFIRKRPINKE